MERLQDTAPSEVKVAAVAAGASFSAPASERSMPGPAVIVLTPDSPQSQPAEDLEEQSSPNLHESSNRVCDYCGANNPDSAAYCHNCATTIVHPHREVRRQEALAGIAASALGKLRRGLLDWRVVLSGRTREFIAAANRAGRKALADFMALPRNTQYTVGGLLALGVIVIAIMIATGPTEPILVETALGTAAVQSAETPLLETEAPSSSRLEVLQRGTELNVLGHVKDPGQRLVRVQVVTPRPRRPGFVALADLGHLSSGDPAVAWQFLGLGRSAADATPEAARAFSQALTDFSERFPGTPQATVAALEQVADSSAAC